MNSDIRRISVQKHDTHLFKTIRRKVSSRESRGYMIQTFERFTHGYLYYRGRKLIGITIWENVEGWPNIAANNPGKQPDYMGLYIYYNPTNMECVLTDLEEQCRIHALEYITYDMFEVNEYPLFLKHDYYIMDGLYADTYIRVLKYMNILTHITKKEHIMNRLRNNYHTTVNVMYRVIVEQYHAEILKTTTISSDTGNQENTFQADRSNATSEGN